jgi:myo-inositol-1(or 4)-monophosphatase
MNSPHRSIDRLATYLDVASTAALAAGKVLQACWGNLESIVEKGRPGDLVTEADKQAEAAILAAFSRPFNFS